MMTFTRVVLIAGLTLTSLAACNRASPPPPPAEVPPPPPPLAFAGLELGKGVDPSMRVVTPTDVFGLRDTIYASVATTGADTSAALGAIWTFGDGQLVDSTTVRIQPSGPANTQFSIMRASAWPVGKYKVSISLNGITVSEKEFEVRR